MVPLKALGGTSDILPEESVLWQEIESQTRRIMKLYGYEEIRTPVIEEASVFTRSLGEATEIVTKQMYNFQDQGGRSVTLRPEGTAPVVRALIEHGLDKTGGLLRWYYMGPMFRAERPQAGRKRQFHQLGVEVFGSASPYQDAEVIQLLFALLKAFGLKDFRLRLNTLGCRNERSVMLDAIRQTFKPISRNLCKDCQTRLQVNPLRIWDCKQPQCKESRDRAVGAYLVNTGPCQECQDHFKKVQEALESSGLRKNKDYVLDGTLVRGLDYHTRTVFEVTAPGLGAQDAVAAGGRYDDLVESMGGVPTPAVGFAIGLDRVLLARQADQKEQGLSKKNTIKAFIATVNAAQIPDALALAEELRDKGISSSANLEDRPLKRQLEHAAKLLPDGYVLILGEDEVRRGIVTVKELSTSQQKKVLRSELAEALLQK